MKEVRYFKDDLLLGWVNRFPKALQIGNKSLSLLAFVEASLYRASEGQRGVVACHRDCEKLGQEVH